MKISLIILNYNCPADTLDCLKSVKAAHTPRDLTLHTIVVDNASSDDSIHLISKKYPEVQLIESYKNLGFAGGNNLGIKAAMEGKPDLLILLNPDTIIHPNFFKDLVKSAIRKRKVGVMSPLIYFASGFEFHQDRYKKSELGKVIWYAGGLIDWQNVFGSHAHVDEVDHGQFKKAEPTGFATGACMVIKPAVINQIGYLNQNYFLYLEDLEFCQRARQAGWQIYFDPHPKLWHKVSQSTGGIGGSLNDYFITRNRLLFGLRFASFRTKLALIRQAATQLFSGTPAQKQAITDLLSFRLGKGTFLK